MAQAHHRITASRSKRIVRPASRERKGFTYKSYNFTDKDPIIYEVYDRIKGTSWAYISEESGVSTTCLYSWFYGGTRRPQNATVRAVLRSVGYDFRIVKVSDVPATAAETEHAKPVGWKPPSTTVFDLQAARRRKGAR